MEHRKIYKIDIHTYFMQIKHKCKGCEWEWEYKGKKKVKPYIQYISCPRCHVLVKLMKNYDGDEYNAKTKS